MVLTYIGIPDIIMCVLEGILEGTHVPMMPDIDPAINFKKCLVSLCNFPHLYQNIHFQIF